MTNILFRCDGSEHIGLGHVSRCLTLAKRLDQNKDINIFFAMRNLELGINFIKIHFPVLIYNEFELYEQWFLKILEENNISRLILDIRHDISKTFLKSLNPKIKKISIDDPENKRLECDLVFYPPVPQVKNMEWKDFNGVYYSGWKYVILKNDFLTTDSASNLLPTNNNVLLTFGGSDPLNLTFFTLKTLLENNSTLRIISIIGPGYKHIDKIKSLLKLYPSAKVKLIFNPNNIHEYIKNVDFGIISFGHTSYEFAALNVPAIYISISKDHEISSNIFIMNNLGISSGLANEINSSILLNKISEIQKKFPLIKKSLLKINLKNQFSSNDMIHKIINCD